MINIPSTFRISFRALRVNKMRSALTMLGIIIGVGAVIAMLAVGTGASKRIAEQISSMGSNLLMILPGFNNGRRRENGRRDPAYSYHGGCRCDPEGMSGGIRMLRPFSTESHRSFMDTRTGQRALWAQPPVC